MNTLQANICLLAVTFIWSCEGFVHSVIPDGVNPFATTCITSLIAAFLLGAYFFRRIGLAIREDPARFFRRVIILGLLNSAYNVLYLMGLNEFNVSFGAFTASMTVVILPVLLLVMHRGVGIRTWISSLIVLSAIVVSLFPSFEGQNLWGLSAMTVGCLIRAVFIVKLNDWARDHDPVTLTMGMSVTSATASFACWFTVEPITFFGLTWSADLIGSYFIYAYFIIALATVLNVYAQRRATPAHATIIYSMEIVFATIWAAILPGDVVDTVPVTAHMVIGCLLVVVGNLVEIVGRKPQEEDNRRRENADVAMIRTAHPYKVLLDNLHSPAVRNVLLFVALLAVYLIIAAPFRVLTVIPGFSDVRPVCMLMPVYGIFFGLPGCFAFGVGNLIADIASDSLRWSSIGGFLGNFLNPFLMYLIWTRVSKKRFHLRTLSMMGMAVMSMLICAIGETAFITAFVAFFYESVDCVVFALSVLGNTFLFPLLFAIPFIILIQEELGFVPLGRYDKPLESVGPSS